MFLTKRVRCFQGPIFYVCRSAGDWLGHCVLCDNVMLQGTCIYIYIHRDTLGSIITWIDFPFGSSKNSFGEWQPWMSEAPDLEDVKKKQVPGNNHCFLLCIEKRSFSSSPKGHPPRPVCPRTMIKSISQWKRMKKCMDLLNRTYILCMWFCMEKAWWPRINVNILCLVPS